MPRRFGISPRAKAETTKVNAGLNDKSGAAIDASACFKAYVEARVAIRLSPPDARIATTNNQSTCGQPGKAIVTANKSGSDNAFGTQATIATGVRTSIRLLIIGRNDVDSAAVNA